MKPILAFLCVIAISATALGADKKIVFDSNGNASWRYETAEERTQRLAKADEAKALAESLNSIRTLTQSNMVSTVNSYLSVFGLPAISSASEITQTWKTNIYAVVNTAYVNANSSQKDDTLLAGLNLYKSIILLLIAP